MRIGWIVTLAVLGSASTIALADSLPASQADAAANQAAQMPPNATVDQVLDAMDARGQNLIDFSAKVKLTNSDASTGDSVINEGTVQFQKKPDGNVRIRVAFDKEQNGDEIDDVDHSYILDAGWLIERDYHKQSETRRQVLKPGEKMNLWKLGEGPFPLPIGQKKEEVRKLFDVTLLPPANDDPANTIHIELKPKAGTPYERRFGGIEVWVDRSNQFPAQIKTKPRGEGSDVHTTTLQKVVVNPAGGLKDADFTPEAVDLTQWNVHVEPYRE